MTTLEQIEMVEAWAWMHVAGGMHKWHEKFDAPRQNMEYLFWGHMRSRYHHVQQRWYAYALWGAWVYQGLEGEGLVQDAKNEVRKKFTRKSQDKKPLDAILVDEVVANLPPFVPPFDNARRLTKAILMAQDDDWRLVAWYKLRGNPLLVHDLRDFRPDLTNYKINQKIKEAEETYHV